jgi:hypothetical protein
MNIQRRRVKGILQSLEHTRIGVASGAPDTVWCPSQSTSRTGRSRVFSEPLRYNSPDCQVCHWTIWWANRAKVNFANGRLQYSLTVRSQSQSVKSECTRLSGAGRRQKTSTVNSSKPQRSADVALTGQWIVECLVHHRTVQCAHRQQSQPTTRKWLETINTPNHLHSSHPSFPTFTFNTRAKNTLQRSN